ncbi:ATP-grasp domain-containing protein [Desulfovermiculus halophilus]|uniref:ATP-grasp domain-containing protein n=1 Tax=Desulfovermiculus halophilus TaxID=339722 RepID=UPI0004817500|nr:ATP-grasp domain-containing protein [Desulfovermiculus halophilus]
MKKNIFIIGLDEFNLHMIQKVKNAENYNFIGLLDIHALIDSGRYRLQDMLDQADAELRSFSGPIDAIVGYTDFPVSTMVPILCERFKVPGPSLESVLKCEHKYWSRLEQKQVIPEYIPKFTPFDPFDDQALDKINLEFPFWIKPVKSTASQLGFRINTARDFQRAVSVLREKIGLFRPFDYLLDIVQLPEEVARVNSSHCVAEQIISGRQCTLEGYVHNKAVHTYGIIDSIREPNRTTFARYQYPSRLPRRVQERMAGITEKVMSRIGLDQSAFNVEFFWNERKDQVWFLEINTRIPQSHSDLFAKVDGVSNHQIMLDVALNRDPWFPKRQGRYKVAGKFFLREYQDKLITAIPTRQDLDDIARRIPGTLIDIQGKVGMKLSEIPEQDSYSYATAFIYLGANSQQELVDKFQQCRKMLTFRFEQPIPVVSPDQAQDRLPETAPQVAIQVLASPLRLPEQKVPLPNTGGVQDRIKP